MHPHHPGMHIATRLDIWLQNSALCIATNSLKMASIDLLHQEASVHPVYTHLSMLCSKFLLSTLRPNHPSHQTITADSGPVTSGTPCSLFFQPSIFNLRLHRVHRTTFSQLRSGFSSAMMDYSIGAKPSSECPECTDPCHSVPHLFSCPECTDPCHSVPHLFSCPARPTDLWVDDMWERLGSGTLPSLCPFFLSPSRDSSSASPAEALVTTTFGKLESSSTTAKRQPIMGWGVPWF